MLVVIFACIVDQGWTERIPELSLNLAGLWASHVLPNCCQLGNALL